MMGEEDKNNEPKRSKQIAEPDNRPVAQHRSGGNLSAGPGHYDQIIARKKFGASDQDEGQSDREDEASDHACGGKTERGVTGNDRIVKRAESDAATSYNRQHEGCQKRQIGLLHADLFDSLFDLGGTI